MISCALKDSEKTYAKSKVKSKVRHIIRISKRENHLNVLQDVVNAIS